MVTVVPRAQLSYTPVSYTHLDSVRARVKDGSSARENYRRMFGQADSFYHMFYSRLNREQQETLEAFIRLPRCSRLGKMGDRKSTRLNSSH